MQYGGEFALFNDSLEFPRGLLLLLYSRRYIRAQLLYCVMCATLYNWLFGARAIMRRRAVFYIACD